MNISIVMLAYKNSEMEIQTLRSILRHKRDFDKFEVIVVSNYDGKEIAEFCNDNGIILIQNNNNLGIPKGWNQGIKKATYELICVTNSDVLFPSRSLVRLCEIMDSEPNIAFLGPTCHFSQRRNPCDNQVKDVPPTTSLGTLNENLFKQHGQKFISREYWISGFCFLVRSSLNLQIGGFDESFGIGIYEEVDYQYRAEKKGFKTGWAPGVYIHHVGDGRQTFHKMVKDDGFDYKGLRKSSYAKFIEKYPENKVVELGGKDEQKS